MDIWFDIKYTYSFTIDSMQPAYGQKIIFLIKILVNGGK